MPKQLKRTAVVGVLKSRHTVSQRISWLFVSAGVILIPLFVSTAGKDVFRLPKELLFEAFGLTLAAVAVVAAIFGRPLSGEHPWPRPLVWIIGGVLTWCTITTLFSTNLTVSIFSLVTVAVSTMFFVSSFNGAQRRAITAVYVALVPAVLNALLTMAQRTALWRPFTIDPSYTGRMVTIGLLGNPDDVGMFLVMPALAAVALALVSRRHRVPGALTAAVLLGGLVATETLGALLAFFVGLVILLFSFRPFLGITAAIVLLGVTLVAIRMSPSRWTRTQENITAARAGDLDPLLSGRFSAFLAASRMFRHHPLKGVGLGAFAFNYFDEKLKINQERPWLITRGDPNFGEVHNEHLQVLAEGGLPAYVLFLAALGLLARVSFLAPASSEEGEFARRLGLPLAATIFVLTLSSFPLRLAAPTVIGLFTAATVLAWSRNASA